MGKCSISLFAVFSIIYDGKRLKKFKSVSRKRLVWKKLKKHFLTSNQKIASTQTLGSAFLKRFQIVQNSKFESDLFKIVDCFFDDYVSVKKERVNCSDIIFQNFFLKSLSKIIIFHLKCFSTNKFTFNTRCKNCNDFFNQLC